MHKGDNMFIIELVYNTKSCFRWILIMTFYTLFFKTMFSARCSSACCNFPIIQSAVDMKVLIIWFWLSTDIMTLTHITDVSLRSKWKKVLKRLWIQNVLYLMTRNNGGKDYCMLLLLVFEISIRPIYLQSCLRS